MRVSFCRVAAAVDAVAKKATVFRFAKLFTTAACRLPAVDQVDVRRSLFPEKHELGRERCAAPHVRLTAC
jgi:hypothetical protein